MEGYYLIGISYTRFNPLTHIYKIPQQGRFYIYTMYRPCTSRIRAKALRYMYRCYTHCTITILYTHTHCCSIYISYAYDGKSRQYIGTCTQLYKCRKLVQSYAVVYKSQLYEVRFYTRSYKMQLRITDGLHNSYPRNLGKCTNVHYAHIIYYERCGMLFPFIRSPIYMSVQDTLDRSNDHFLLVVFLLACNHKTTHFWF